MPIKDCEQDGKPGYKWGDSGHCYLFTPGDEESRKEARRKAEQQAQAAYAHGYGKSDSRMLITKEFEPTRSEIGKPNASDLEAIRSLALDKSIGEDDVFVVTMHLANDQYDRSHERFPVSVLERFAATIHDKPVMVGHDKSREPAGRFFSGDVVPQTDGSHHLVTRSFLDVNDPLVAKIRKGIVRHVSIGATADKRLCDVCGNDWDNRDATKAEDRCGHNLGAAYGNKTCRITWGGDLAKYETQEGSFVYLGCQFGAQVVAQNAPAGIVKTAAPGGTIILDYGADPAPQEGSMDELKAAQEKITALEAEVATLKAEKTENEPLVAAGKEYLDHLKEDALKKSAAVSEADKKQTEAFLGTITTPNLTLLKTIHGSVMQRFDEKFPPRPEGQDRDVTKDTPRPFDPVGVNPFRRSA